MTSSTPTPSTGGMTDAEAVVRLFGADPWMRFDLWSSRAWEVSQSAVEAAESMGADEELGPRIISMFHAASVAKEFADMVNPITAVCGSMVDDGNDTIEPTDLSLDMIVDNEE